MLNASTLNCAASVRILLQAKLVPDFSDNLLWRSFDIDLHRFIRLFQVCKLAFQYPGVGVMSMP